MNAMLTRSFDCGEIKKALFDMYITKAPGQHGLQALFFQKNWHTIGVDVTQTPLVILNDGGGVGKWNISLRSLIPKVNNPKVVKDCRPISLCNVIHKITS